MKHILNIGFLSLLLGIALISCNDRNNNDYINQQVAPTQMKIDSVQILSPTMSVYSVQSIRTYSTFTPGCTAFYGYNYVPDGLTRTVTAYSYSTGGTCGTAAAFGNQFTFQPVTAGTYMFKFWNGKDTSGNDLYITKNIVVK
jgi:hypothetical protein